jgi:hypothetical protein
MTNLQGVYQRSESLVTRDLAGEKIIVPVRGKVGDLNSIYTLNSVANEIWLLLDGRRTVHEIVDSMQDEYDVDPAILTDDVCRVLEELSQEGLIQRRAI